MTTTSAELADLLTQVATGDRAAFAQVYRDTSAKLYGTVLRILKHQGLADEIVQEAYVKVWQRADRFIPGKASPITWLVTIARNCALDELRRQHMRFTDNPDALAQIEDTDATAVEKIEMNQAMQQLDQCLDGLEPQRRHAVKLAYLDGFSRQDLADRFDQPLGTIKTWLHRSLKQLKTCLES